MRIKAIARNVHAWRAQARRATSRCNLSIAGRKPAIVLGAEFHPRGQIVRSFSPSARQSIWDAAAVLRSDGASGDEKIGALRSLQLHVKSEAKQTDHEALAIVQSDAIQSVMDLLAHPPLRLQAVVCLISLSTNTTIAEEMLRLNAPNQIVPMMADSDFRLQAAACLLVGNLALHASAESTVATRDLVDALLTACNSEHEAIQRSAVTALGSIGSFASGRELLLTEGIAQLVDLLPEGSDALRCEAGYALGNILSNRDINAQDLMMETGALSELTLMLSPAHPEDVISAAAWAIHHAVHLNPANQSLLGEAGGIDMLAGHVQVCDQLGETAQTNVLLALSSILNHHQENQQRAKAADVHSILVELQDQEDLNVHAQRAVEDMLQMV